MIRWLYKILGIKLYIVKCSSLRLSRNPASFKYPNELNRYPRANYIKNLFQVYFPEYEFWTEEVDLS